MKKLIPLLTLFAFLGVGAVSSVSAATTQAQPTQTQQQEKKKEQKKEQKKEHKKEEKKQ